MDEPSMIKLVAYTTIAVLMGTYHLYRATTQNPGEIPWAAAGLTAIVCFLFAGIVIGNKLM